MAIVAINKPFIWDSFDSYVSSTGSTMNAVGESNFVVGKAFWPSQTGTKTISAAGGGRIVLNTAGSITWANGATNVRFGIQDMGTAGFEDGTFDVYADLVPGVESFANNLLYSILMESGSKTLSFGQDIAIGATMTARGGADSFTLDRISNTTGFPYNTHLSSKNFTPVPTFLIIFDDGTYGWIDLLPLLFNTAGGSTVITFNSDSIPDEYIGTFSPTVPMRLTAIGVEIGAIATADTFEVILYSDPYGTPSVIETITPDPDNVVQGEAQVFTLTTVRDLTVGSVYGVALRPTSANNITWRYADSGSGFDILKNAQLFPSIKMAKRTDQTGAFSETQAYHLPRILLGIGGFDNGVSAGSVETTVGFVGVM